MTRRSTLTAVSGDQAALSFTRCGVSTLTAFGLAGEICDRDRVTGSPGQQSAPIWVWCRPRTPRADPVHKDPITKTGNGHDRRLLVEAAWHHRKTYRSPGKILRERWELAPVAARLRGHEGNRRLHLRWQTFDERKKKPVIANVAIAHELDGWCWSLAVLE